MTDNNNSDPENFDYLCVSGCRRDIRTWDMEENNRAWTNKQMPSPFTQIAENAPTT